ncbi:hypothetical protein [Gilvimarinus algae]|uniref:Uncharacterized protein n=1 Tax=Gilvimarinus algae TaxID=3058037 RepID=A0ABT8TI35_9GAMM|nr:hypothetical protein [Gilvimarinus sp. SDUM040014]MDO3383762.1 hypothetical protein [Gilvimarinus sp. SDUM040014]
MNKELPEQPLTEEESDNLMSLILEMVNHEEYKAAQVEFHRTITKMQMKHGELAQLTAMKADFLDTEDPIDRVRLYQRSIELAQSPLDISVLVQSSGSIAEIYIEDLADHPQGLKWLGIYKDYINQYGNKYAIDDPSDLEANLRRLKFYVV